MKTNLLKSFVFKGVVCLLNIGVVATSSAQVEGDLKSRANNSGWGGANTWYNFASGNWATSTTILPSSTSNMFLRDGFTHTSNGSGAPYTVASITVGSGFGFRANAVLTGGVVTGITIIDEGKLNSITSLVGIYGAATTQAVASIASVKVTGADFINKGTGYTNASVNIGSSWMASTAYTANAQVSNGGNLYTCVTAGTSDAGGGPSGNGSSINDGTAVWKYAGVAATASATISGGTVSDIVITNAGSGYISVPSMTISGDGTGASYSTLVGVESINISNGGAGYTNSPLVTVGTIFQVGNASTNRTVVSNGDVKFLSGANLISGGGTSASVNQALTIGGNLSAVTPISFKTNQVTTVGNTNVTFNKAGTASITGANMVFNNLTVNAGTTLNISNDITIMGTLTNNGTINITSNDVELGTIVNNASGIINISGTGVTSSSITNSGSINITNLMGVNGTITNSGAINGPYILPVKITNYYAKANLNNIQIIWTTTSETNNDKFIVEKSLDGKVFSKIAEVKAKGASNYQVTDINPAEGVNYYRLVQFDFDGKSEVFEPISATFNIKKNEDLTVFPNPTSGPISFNATGLIGDITVDVTALNSVVIHQEKIVNNGASSYTINLNKKLASGKYLVSVKAKGFFKSVLVVVL